MTDKDLVQYIMLTYLSSHPNAESAIAARLEQLAAGAYIPANDPQAATVVQAATTFLQAAQQRAQVAINRLQTLAQQSTPVV